MPKKLSTPTPQLLATITKVDAVQKLVYGVLAEQKEDKTKEVFDYDSSKPYFQAWNQKFADVTGGKSVGNCRLMHTTQVAGKFISMDYNDDEKNITVCAKITDDAVWKLVDDGVLTGFSIGAFEKKSWKKDNLKYWTADPFEGSVVDNPCMYGATFTELKAAGESVTHKFALPDGAKELSDKIIAAHVLGTIQKGMYTVSDFASVIAYLNSVRVSIKWEEQYEGDTTSDVQKQLAQKIEELVAILKQYLSEEAGELLNDVDDDYEVIVEMSPTLQLALNGLTTKKTATTEEGSDMTPEQLKTITDGQTAIQTGITSNATQIKAVADGQIVIATELDNMKTAQKGTDSVVEALAKTLSTLMSAPVATASKTVTKDKDGNEQQEAAPASVATRIKAPVTPDEEFERSQKSLAAIKAIHKSGGISIEPGSSDYLATGR